MKKRLFSLALTLALCLGLITPTIAADTSGLDASSAKAFYNALSAYEKQNVHVAYADLKDMDGDSVPELIVVTVTKEDPLDDYIWHENITVDIWRARNGQAMKGASEDFGTFRECFIRYATQNGKVYLHVDRNGWSDSIGYSDTDYISADGIYEGLGKWFERNPYVEDSEETEYSYTITGTSTAITEQQYWQYQEQCQKKYLDDDYCIVEITTGSPWPTEGTHHSSYQNVLNQLNVKASTTATPAPAAGTYGPYTITGVMYDGSPYEVSFSAAKVEQKTVQIRGNYDIGGGYSSYQNEAVTLVTIRPDTNVTVSGSVGDGVPVEVGKVDGNNKYTQMVLGAAQYIHNGIGKQSFEWDLTPDFVRLGDYLICEDATAYTNGGFMDVKAGAYYEDAVKWAVDKKITSGTSATIFSPDSTCTVAQILTFLWRANGSLRPTVRNPFSDISSNDYFYEAAIWAYEKGLIPDTGYFLSKNEPCTRKMVAYFLWKLAGAPTSIPSGQYVAQNITVEDDGTCYLRFSGATLKETTITEHVPIWADDGPEVVGWRNEPAKVTLITMRPGSTVTVNTPHKYDGGDNISGNAYSITSDGKYHDMTWNIPASVYTGAVENAFQYSIGNIEDAGQTAVKLYSWVDLDKGVYKIYMLQMAPVSTKFTDVSANAYYAQAVEWAVKQGVTVGTSDTTFSPNATCTRGQIVTFLYRAMGK